MMTGDITTSDGQSAITIDQLITIRLPNDNKITNYCADGKKSKDAFGNCCATGTVSNGICVPASDSSNTYNAILVQEADCNAGTETTEDPRYFCEATYETTETNTTYTVTNNKRLSLYCVNN